MFERWVRGLAALSVVFSSTVAPAASLRPRDCCAAPAPCESAPAAMVTRTVMVPEWTTETRTVCVTEMKQEPRQKTVFVPIKREIPKQVVETIVKRVPVTRTYTLVDTIFHQVKKMEIQKFYINCPRIERRTITETVLDPIRVQETVEKTVLIPFREEREGVRQRCQLIPQKVMKTITRDCGYWTTVTYEVPACVGCNKDIATTLTQCKRVWVPKLVQEQVCVTIYKPAFYTEPYTYCVTCFKPETRTVQQCVSEIQTEERTKTVIDTQCGFESRLVSYMASVPVIVKKEVQVKVCKMVPKVIQVPAGNCCH
jgi:hypothetical protein